MDDGQDALAHALSGEFDLLVLDIELPRLYVRYLRKKLGAERIETVRGMGYRLAGG